MRIAITGIGETIKAYNNYDVDVCFSFAELTHPKMYEHLLELLDKDAIVVGHSAGSLVAICAAKERVIKQLILIGPGLQVSDSSELMKRNPLELVNITKTNPSFVYYVNHHMVGEIQNAERFRIQAANDLTTVLANTPTQFIFAATELSKQIYTQSLLNSKMIPYEIISGTDHYNILNNRQTKTYVNTFLKTIINNETD